MLVIEHFDAVSRPRVWVVMLNSGLQCRTGPQRLYLRIARELCKLGYGVIRVDLPGVGDSDGPTPPTHFDLHDPLNVRDVLTFVSREHKPDKTVLLGLCAGARVSVKAAMLNAEVDGVIALSMPTFTASPGSERSPEEPDHRLSKTVARHNVDRLRNIFRNKRFRDPKFWQRYLNPRNAIAEFMYLGRSIHYLAVGRRATDNLGQFIKTLVLFAESPTKKLFIFGERDKIICQEFEELALNLTNGAEIRIPDGTHTFSTFSSHRQAVRDTARWLQQEFPPSHKKVA